MWSPIAISSSLRPTPERSRGTRNSILNVQKRFSAGALLSLRPGRGIELVTPRAEHGTFQFTERYGLSAGPPCD